jgi:hypothetical protein
MNHASRLVGKTVILRSVEVVANGACELSSIKKGFSQRHGDTEIRSGRRDSVPRIP